MGLAHGVFCLGCCLFSCSRWGWWICWRWRPSPWWFSPRRSCRPVPGSAGRPAWDSPAGGCWAWARSGWVPSPG